MSGLDAQVWRCDKTGNPYGTDTIMIGYVCDCQGCNAARHIRETEAEVARLREALQRIADARAGDHRTLHPFDCSDFARQALAQEQADG